MKAPPIPEGPGCVSSSSSAKRQKSSRGSVRRMFGASSLQHITGSNGPRGAKALEEALVIRQIVRKIIRRSRTWLEDEQPPAELTHYAVGEHAYDWIIAAFESLMRDTECQQRPAYVWGVLQGAGQVQTCRIPRICAIGFGVAGGRGLLALERIGAKVSEITGVQVHVIGFDTGTGLTSPIDHRDVPNLLWTGRFPMDVEALGKRLTTASLVLGPIAETLPRFLHGQPPRVAFVSVDVDLYSSTVDCLRLFDATPSLLVPRVYCYFDDIHGYTYSDCNGELLAIAEFNASHPRRQICKIHGLKFFAPSRFRDTKWVECFYIAHVFDHELYAERSSIATPEHDQRIAGP
jgi:hypothetical protein